MAEKEATERRVYVLPMELVERVRRYQRSQLISSEVEAVRRLLDAALQLRDDVETILDKFHDKFKVEKDMRVLARDILAVHPLVESITHHVNSVEFRLKSAEKGLFDVNGKSYIWNEDFDQWKEYDQIPF